MRGESPGEGDVRQGAAARWSRGEGDRESGAQASAPPFGEGGWETVDDVLAWLLIAWMSCQSSGSPSLNLLWLEEAR